MNSMKKKALAFAAAACAFGMLLSGCGSSNGGSTADKGSNVITAYNSEPQNPLIPGNTNETGGGILVDLLFARLVSYDTKGNAQNEVAESIKSNDDGTQFDIKIKSGWKFADGTPVTAESFTKAWSYVANAKNAQKCSSFFSTIKGFDKLQDAENLKGDEQLEGLKVVNDHEFTVDLNQPDSVFAIKVGYSAFAPLPESFYKDPKAFGEKPVGNGPYKFKSWSHNKQIELVKTNAYKGNENLKYNPKKAKELWAKAEAISHYDGKLTFAYNADGGAKSIYDAVVNSVKNTLGIDVATNPIPTFQEFRNDVTNRSIQGAFRTGWQPDYPSPENYLYQLYSSAAADGNGSNDGDYKNAEFDKLCSEASAAKSTDEANKIYQQAQEILLKELPAFPLYYSNANGVAATGVKGFEMNWQNLPVYNELTK